MAGSRQQVARTERTRLVAKIRAQLERRGWPRVQIFLIVSLAGFAGFLVSYALLSAGLSSMAARYAAAGSAAYLAFLALIAAWIAWQRRGGPDLDVIDWVDLPAPRLSGGGSAKFDGFSSGGSGGGGASAAWGQASVSGGSGGSWLDVDGDDLGWVLLALAAVLAGALAVTYVIWIAPALLAEVLVDAAIVSAVARKVSRVERRDWTATVLRRTWLAAVVIVVTLAAGGYALQRLAPEARSIGPAVETILRR